METVNISKPVANYLTVLNEVRQFILDNAPEGLRAHDVSRLQDAIAWNKDYAYLNLEWNQKHVIPPPSDDLDPKAFSAYASLTFDVEQDHWRDLVDEEGNHWSRCAVKVQTGWASFGGDVPEVQMTRIRLMFEVTQLAASIAEKWGSMHLYVMRRTAAEVKEEQAKEEARRIERKAKDYVLGTRTKMRVGTERQSMIQMDIPKGEYKVETDDGKAYILHVYIGYQVLVRTR